MQLGQRKSYFSLYMAWLLAAIATGVLAPAPSHAALFSISEKEEIQAGKQVAAQARKEYGGSLPYNNPMSVRVRAIGQMFARLSSRKNIPFSYEVLNNEKILNAFAAPGGPVFVTRKLVETTANDAELAYVLGHETGHIEMKHIVKAVEKQQKVGLGVGILGAILGGGHSSDIFSVFSNVAFTVWSRGYSRDQESEADAVGVRWMSRLGFDPRAAISMLGKLDSGGGGGLDRYLATHPDPKTRQGRVQQEISKEKLVEVATKAGGPFLNAKNLPPFDYKGASRDTSTSASDNSFYPDDAGYNAPDDDFDKARLANFDAPLLMVNRDDYNVIAAPVAGFARWANAEISSDARNADVVTLRRGHNSIRLRRGSAKAVVNGKTVQMPAAAQIYNELLYAPLGNLADGVGADAALSGDNRTIWLTLDGQRWYMNLH
jgi:Zn-dependent protease with chaperone function